MLWRKKVPLCKLLEQELITVEWHPDAFLAAKVFVASTKVTLAGGRCRLGLDSRGSISCSLTICSGAGGAFSFSDVLSLHVLPPCPAVRPLRPCAASVGTSWDLARPELSHKEQPPSLRSLASKTYRLGKVVFYVKLFSESFHHFIYTDEFFETMNQILMNVFSPDLQTKFMC